MKRLILLAATLVVFLVAAAPALAQGEAQYSQYAPEGPPLGSEITATGVIKQLELTTFMYGTHGLHDGDTGEFYALTSGSVDLNDYNGQRVTIYGTVVTNGQFEGDPTLLDVYHVEPLDGAGGSTTPSFEGNDSMDNADGSGTGNGWMDETADDEVLRESNSAGSPARSTAGSAAEMAGIRVLPSTGGLSLLLPATSLLLAIGLIGFKLLHRS